MLSTEPFLRLVIIFSKSEKILKLQMKISEFDEVSLTIIQIEICADSFILRCVFILRMLHERREFLITWSNPGPSGKLSKAGSATRDLRASLSGICPTWSGGSFAGFIKLTLASSPHSDYMSTPFSTIKSNAEAVTSLVDFVK